MSSKSFPVIGAVAFLLALACSRSSLDHPTGTGGTGGGTGGSPPDGGAGAGGSGGMGGELGDGRYFVPEDLPITKYDEVGNALTLIALTLAQGAAGPELYASVRNDAQTPVCEAGIMIDFFDGADQVVATSGVGLQSGRLYRLDESTVLSCIEPGQIAMGAATNLPEELVIGELGYLKHRIPHFMLGGIVPIEPLSVSPLETVTTAAGSVYRGTVTNPLDVPVSTPKVTVFPVNRVGRPLGVATSTAAADIPPGGSWSFETSAVADVGVGAIAYPAASIGN